MEHSANVKTLVMVLRASRSSEIPENNAAAGSSCCSFLGPMQQSYI